MFLRRQSSGSFCLCISVFGLLACNNSTDQRDGFSATASQGTGQADVGESGEESSSSGGAEEPKDSSRPNNSSGQGESQNNDSSGMDEEMGEEESDSPRFDVPQSDVSDEESEMEEVVSYIWIANSGAGTVSKIDTRSLVEKGRYATTADGRGSPSRTSVNLDGDAVVVNRTGGIMKVISQPKECPDQNGDGKITTSTGKDDVLAYGEDECVVWQYKAPATTAARPAAWTAGVYDPETEERSGFEVWTAWIEGPKSFFALLDGETGDPVWSQEYSEITQGLAGGNSHNSGVYGMAVDRNNDVWGITVRWDNQVEGAMQLGELIHISYESKAIEVIPVPYAQVQYGMGVDEKSRPWICGSDIYRYDPATRSMQQTGALPEIGTLGRGCMSDGDGTMWVAAGKSVVGIDIESMKVTRVIETDGNSFWGISHDYDGNIWAVPRGGQKAYRIDPVAETFDFYEGLNGPYTYSDMTGFSLATVSRPVE